MTSVLSPIPIRQRTLAGVATEFIVQMCPGAGIHCYVGSRLVTERPADWTSKFVH